MSNRLFYCELHQLLPFLPDALTGDASPRSSGRVVEEVAEGGGIPAPNYSA